MNRPQTRKRDWYDTKKGEPLFSFQIKHNGVWHNAMSMGSPCFYKTPEERDEAVKKFVGSREG